ncbi:hypothetical protein VTO42DRAFT_8073 [Malbranchea cinnamomea]
MGCNPSSRKVIGHWPIWARKIFVPAFHSARAGIRHASRALTDQSGDMMHDISNKGGQLPSSNIISFATGASLTMLQEIAHSFKRFLTGMAEEQISVWIHQYDAGDIKLGGQGVDIILSNCGRTTSGFEVVEQGGHGGEDLIATLTADISGPVLGGMLKEDTLKR